MATCGGGGYIYARGVCVTNTNTLCLRRIGPSQQSIIHMVHMYEKICSCKYSFQLFKLPLQFQKGNCWWNGMSRNVTEWNFVNEFLADESKVNTLT